VSEGFTLQVYFCRGTLPAMIRLIEARRYKCLKYIRQPLAPFQILVGPNASGKTSLLDVVAFVQDLVGEGAEAAVRKRARSLRELVWQQEGDSFELALELTLPDTLTDSQVHAARYEVRVGLDSHGAVALLGENLWLLSTSEKDLNTVQPALFPSERADEKPVLRESGKRKPQGWQKVMGRSEDGRIHIHSETTGWNFQLRLTPIRSGLTAIPEEEERFGRSLWVRGFLLHGVQSLTLNSLQMRRPCPSDVGLEFLPDGSNLPKVVRHFREAAPQQFRRWIAHLQTVLPDLEDLWVKEREEDRYLYLVAVFRGGLQVPSWLLSDGTLRLIALTLIAYLSASGDNLGASGTYLIEEPENGIHPKALEAVYQSLSSAYRSQILCTTHSALLLNLADPSQLLCFARTQSGATDIVRGDYHPLLRDYKKEIPLGTLLASGVLG
jgi:predicted ATPase